MNTQFLPILTFFVKSYQMCYFFRFACLIHLLAFLQNLTIYFDDHYYCYYISPEKGVLFHIELGYGSVTMERAHMKFVYLVSASDVLSYATKFIILKIKN
jgi:hypothetical protein